MKTMEKVYRQTLLMSRGRISTSPTACLYKRIVFIAINMFRRLKVFYINERIEVFVISFDPIFCSVILTERRSHRLEREQEIYNIRNLTVNVHAKNLFSY